MLRCWKKVSMEEQDKTVYRSNSYLTGANYDTLSIRMEQTLSEITSLDSGPHEHSHFSDSSSEGKQMWNIHMHIWILIVELYIKLGQVIISTKLILLNITSQFFISFPRLRLVLAKD